MQKQERRQGIKFRNNTTYLNQREEEDYFDIIFRYINSEYVREEDIKRLEKELGFDLSSFRIYKGARARKVSEEKKAEAVVTKDAVYFKEEKPKEETVAHEATHILQMTIGTLNENKISEATAEKEAEEFAQIKNLSHLSPANKGVYLKSEKHRSPPERFREKMKSVEPPTSWMSTLYEKGLINDEDLEILLFENKISFAFYDYIIKKAKEINRLLTAKMYFENNFYIPKLENREFLLKLGITNSDIVLTRGKKTLLPTHGDKRIVTLDSIDKAFEGIKTLGEISAKISTFLVSLGLSPSKVAFIKTGINAVIEALSALVKQLVDKEGGKIVTIVEYLLKTTNNLLSHLHYFKDIQNLNKCRAVIISMIEICKMTALQLSIISDDNNIKEKAKYFKILQHMLETALKLLPGE